MISSTLQAPRVYDSWMRDYVGERIVKITNQDGNSGGTGFHAKLPSGKTVIITNKHVCEGVGQDGKVWIHESLHDSYKIQRRIFYISETTDVCEIEAIPGIEGLTFAPQDLKPGDHVWVYGHPHLYPLTKSEGEIIGEENVAVIAFQIRTPEDRAACRGRYKIEKTRFLFWEMNVCVSNFDSYLSNLNIFPGNSGSPVLDSLGRVISIVYAGDSSMNWGIFLAQDELQKFLKQQPF